MDDKSLQLMVTSLKVWGLYPPPLSSLWSARNEPEGDGSDGRRTPAKKSNALSIFMMSYSLFLLILAWLNALRFVTLYQDSSAKIHVDITYAMSISLYYFVGAILRTSIVVSCWYGGSQWQRLIDQLSMTDIEIRTGFFLVEERANFALHGKTSKRTKLHELNFGRNFYERFWLVSAVVGTWFVVSMLTASLATLMVLHRENFSLLATPFQQELFKDVLLWPQIVGLCSFLQLITDSGVFFATSLVSCLAVVQVDQFKAIRRLCQEMCPKARGNHASQLKIDLKVALEKLHSASSAVPVPETREYSGYFDLDCIRYLYFRMEDSVSVLDRLGRFVVMASMIHGFFSLLVITHHIMLSEVTLFGMPMWVVWLFVAFHVLFVTIIASAYLNASANALCTLLHYFSSWLLSKRYSRMTELLVLLNRMSNTQIALTFLHLMPLRKQTLTVLLGALFTYLVVLADYSTQEAHHALSLEHDHTTTEAPPLWNVTERPIGGSIRGVQVG